MIFFFGSTYRYIFTVLVFVPNNLARRLCSQMFVFCFFVFVHIKKKHCHTLHKETLQQRCIGMGILFFYANSNATCPRTGNSLSSSLTHTHTLTPRKRQNPLNGNHMPEFTSSIDQNLTSRFFSPSKMWEILTCTLSDELLPLH